MPAENPDPIAALDQLMRGLGDYARLLARYTQACESQGFSRSEAIALTIAYQRDVLAKFAGGGS